MEIRLLPARPACYDARMRRILFLLSLCLALSALWLVGALRSQPTVAPDERVVRGQITAVAAPTKAR